MTREEKIQEVLDRVAEGVWGQSNLGFYTKECAFCYASIIDDHDEDCPVRLARELYIGDEEEE
jgi:hypothetical protein